MKTSKCVKWLCVEGASSRGNGQWPQRCGREDEKGSFQNVFTIYVEWCILNNSFFPDTYKQPSLGHSKEVIEKAKHALQIQISLQCLILEFKSNDYQKWKLNTQNSKDTVLQLSKVVNLADWYFKFDALKICKIFIWLSEEMPHAVLSNKSFK